MSERSRAPSVRIRDAHDAASVPLVRTLFREYAADLGHDLTFQHFDEELAALPGAYAPPRGALLVAEAFDGDPAGCVALRPLTAADCCEMKRLWVRPRWQRQGIARKLCVELLERAHRAGHERMRLDTLAHMTPAVTLYESLGFRRIDAYYENPLANVIYLERSL